MRTTVAGFAALLLAGAVYVQPGHAQMAPQGSNSMPPMQPAPQEQSYQSTGADTGVQGQLPQGSYSTSCNDVRMEGQSLIAFCPKGDGTWKTTVLSQTDQCAGDILNVNGDLQCSETGYGSSIPPSQLPPPSAQPR